MVVVVVVARAWAWLGPAPFAQVLVCAGVHARELGIAAQGTTEAPTDAALAAFLRSFAPHERPTHVVPAFVLEE